MRSIRTLVALVASATLLAVGAMPASASPTAIPTSSYVDASCAAQIEALALAPADATAALEFCVVSRGGTVGAPASVTTAQILADKSLTASARAELVNASAASTIKSRTWSQFTTGGGYTVTHGGKFYYNGTRVWATVTYSGYKGSHNCVTNYAVVVNISQRSCNESGSTTSRAMYNSWTVAWLVEGSAVSYDVSMTATLTKSGGVSGFGTTWS